MAIIQSKPCFGSKAAFTQSRKVMYRDKPSLILKKVKLENRAFKSGFFAS